LARLTVTLLSKPEVPREVIDGAGSDRNGLLDGRRLVLEPDTGRAYLEDR
jgi:hypothetical protein